MSRRDDLRLMRRALALARQATGYTSPNPMVGCVIVRDGQILGEGRTQPAGQDHAEIQALKHCRAQGHDPRGATVYVNLEPCNHFGRTGPCAAALVEAGVARVVVGMIDPNPKVSGGGIATLRAANIAVDVGLLSRDSQALNQAFCKHILEKLPFVTLKVAQTLDGRTATHNGDSKWITGPEARRAAHRLRAEVDAIVSGVETVLADDPQFTVRDAPRRQGPQGPLRVIVDSHLRTPPSAKLFTEPGPRVILATTSHDRDKAEALTRAGAEILPLAAESTGRVDLRALLQSLGARGVIHVLVEAGGTLNGAFLDANLVDRVCVFVAPRLLGAQDARAAFAGHPRALLRDSVRLGPFTIKRLGPDLLLTSRVLPPESDDVYRAH
jgi:diaminohydroxyphosphoribosylaminopyrimidine deaminase/5-amino-6-(5-phosphoribosylamino)uracil reductase